MALRWSDIYLKAGTIDVARSWDLEHGRGDTRAETGVVCRSPRRCASTWPPNGCASLTGVEPAPASHQTGPSGPDSLQHPGVDA
jgi:hypothetical protein